MVVVTRDGRGWHDLAKKVMQFVSEGRYVANVVFSDPANAWTLPVTFCADKQSNMV
jgi:hypothetical protein